MKNQKNDSNRNDKTLDSDIPDNRIHLDIFDEILRLAYDCGVTKTFCPTDIAYNLFGSNPQSWGAFMPKIKAIATELALSGQIAMYKHGKLIDPQNISGSYRLQLTRHD